MITRPSLPELVAAVAAAVEREVGPAVAGTPVADRVPGMLTLLDRVQAELPLAALHLAEDNVDLALTLDRLARLVPDAGVTAGDQVDPASPVATVDALAERNRALKAALVAAMDALALPARPDAPAAVREADREVLDLLARLLRREAAAVPETPARVSSMSRGAATLESAEVEHLTSTLQRFVAAQQPGATGVRVHALRPLAGGASREAFRFEVTWRDGAEHRHEACVLLRQPVSSVLESDEPGGAITGSRRLPGVEFAMIRRMEAQGIPVPHVLWVDPDGSWLERPFSIARWIDGEADHTTLPGVPHRDRILDQYVDVLARLHGVDPAAAGVDFLGAPTCESAALEQVELFAAQVERQRLEDLPALAYLVRWLRAHAPTARRVGVVHGDFRLGNVMWDDTGLVAVLDWEQCHLGDPVEEIAFMYWPMWTLHPFLPIRQLVARYERAGGVTVDDTTLGWYRMFIELKMSVVLLTGLRSFYATEERQLRYGGSRGLRVLRESQQRVLDALLAGGPTVEFGDGAP